MPDPARPVPPLPVATSPPLNLAHADLAALVPALTAYQAEFAPFFTRREQRTGAGLYLQGLLTAEVPRKNVEALALWLLGVGPPADAQVRALQHFLSEAPWDDAPILVHHQELVARSLGEEAGVLIVDGSDVAKQGTHSVGVARQYCGATGKQDNCQAGVYLAYASSCGATLLDRRLYVPAAWFAADHADLRDDCGLPADLEFRTRTQLAAEMVEAVQTRGELPAHWLTADEAFGEDPAFLDRVAGTGLWYLAEVPRTTPVWPLVEPASGEPRMPPRRWVPPPPPSRKGPVPRRAQLHPDSPPKETVATVAAALPATGGHSWLPYRILEGRKGPLVAELTAVRVIAVRERLPGPQVWLVLRRQIVGPGEKAEVKYYLSNAPAETELGVFAWASGMRWPIESCLEESKGEVGLDEYECRSWVGWHHHMTLVILAHHFLVQQQVVLNRREGGLQRGAPGSGQARGSSSRLQSGLSGTTAGARQSDQCGPGEAVSNGRDGATGARCRGGAGAGHVLPAAQRGGLSRGA
jgi:SRSO17 transposase